MTLYDIVIFIMKNSYIRYIALFSFAINKSSAMTNKSSTITNKNESSVITNNIGTLFVFKSLFGGSKRNIEKPTKNHIRDRQPTNGMEILGQDLHLAIDQKQALEQKNTNKEQQEQKQEQQEQKQKQQEQPLQSSQFIPKDDLQDSKLKQEDLQNSEIELKQVENIDLPLLESALEVEEIGSLLAILDNTNFSFHGERIDNFVLVYDVKDKKRNKIKTLKVFEIKDQEIILYKNFEKYTESLFVQKKIEIFGNLLNIIGFISYTLSYNWETGKKKM